MAQLEGFLRKQNKELNDPIMKKIANKPKNPENSLKIYTNNFFFPDFQHFYPKNLFFKPPNAPASTTTKKFNPVHPTNLISSPPNNFFNRLRKNHSISNITSPNNNNPNTKKFDRNKDKFIPFRRSSINSALANKSLNNTAKSNKPSKSNTKTSIHEEKNQESSHDNMRLMQIVNDCSMKANEIQNIINELTQDKVTLRVLGVLSEKIEKNFETKKEEINRLEGRLREKDDKIRKLLKEKEDFLCKKPDVRPENNRNGSDMVKENMILKEKIMEQQGKIVALKAQEKKFLQFLKELNHKGIDLEKLYEEKQLKKKRKEEERKKVVEELLVPQLIDLETFSYRADESIVNDSKESSFNYYGKPILDDSFLKIEEPKVKVKNIGSEKKKDRKFKINLNLKAVKNPQIENNNNSNSK